MAFNSIRWRFQVWYGIILLAVLAGFGVTVFQLERVRRLRDMDAQLRLRADALLQSLPLNGPPRRGPGNDFQDDTPQFQNTDGRRQPGFRLVPGTERMFATEAAGPDYYYFVYTRNHDLLSKSGNAPATHGANYSRNPGKTANSGADKSRTEAIGGGVETLTLASGEYREMEERTPLGEVIIAGCHATPVFAEMKTFGWSLAGIGGVVLACGMAGGWWLASRALRPIDGISSAATRIAAGDLSQRIDVEETRDELGQLAAVLNSTFSRLETAFSQQGQFTADAAHELRTPVSVILAQTQLALKQERSAADYRETVEACQRAAQRMKRLIESLLQLARLDAGQESMNRQTVDLGRVTRDCAEMVRPLAAERGIMLSVEATKIEVTGDGDRLAQVLTNLLTNAIQYNKTGGEVKVTAAILNGMATLKVADNGPGISADDLPHVFDRFYRADKSRSNPGGRTGLGLAICKAIISAHGGTLDAESTLGKGATFTVRLPVNIV